MYFNDLFLTFTLWIFPELMSLVAAECNRFICLDEKLRIGPSVTTYGFYDYADPSVLNSSQYLTSLLDTAPCPPPWKLELLCFKNTTNSSILSCSQRVYLLSKCVGESYSGNSYSTRLCQVLNVCKTFLTCSDFQVQFSNQLSTCINSPDLPKPPPTPKPTTAAPTLKLTTEVTTSSVKVTSDHSTLRNNDSSYNVIDGNSSTVLIDGLHTFLTTEDTTHGIPRTPSPRGVPEEGSGGLSPLVIFFILLICILIFITMNKMPRKRRQTYKAKEQNTGKEQNTEENNEQDTISCSGTDTLTENTKDQDMGQIDDNASEVSNASLASGSKKQRANCSLSQSEEQNLVEWIKENEILWNRNKQGFRNKSVKETIWKDKATEMNKDVKYLMTWYESLRTRFGRLKKKAKGKSGDGKESVNRNKWTDREIWVYDNFVFLSDFVGEVLTRPLQPLCPPRDASPPSTVTTDVPADDDDEVQSIFMDSEGPHMDSGSQYSSSSMSTKGRGRSSRQIVADKMAEDRSRMLNIQEQMLTLIKPVPELSERQAFGEWITTSMRDVDQSLWRSFKMRIIGVVDEFLAASENIKKKRATPPQFQTPAAQKPLYSQAGTPLGTLQQASSSSYSWQPSSDTWQMYPNTQSNISWPQQNTSWVSSNVQQQQIEVTQLQPAAATSATQQSSTLHETSPIQSMYQDQALNTSQQQE